MCGLYRPLCATKLGGVQSCVVEIEAAERTLLGLAERLDQPFVSRGEPDDVFMAIGHRSRALYRGYHACFEAGQHTATRLLLRPMVEANVLLRFIREEPEWRVRLWQAETKRQWIAIAQDIRSRPLPREQRFGPLPTDEELAEFRRQVAELRELAIEAGVAGVPGEGALIPSVVRQAEILNTQEVWQAYVVGYRPLGLEQHIAHGSFGDAFREPLADGRVIHHDPETPRLVERVLASSVFASTLVVVSSWLGLGIEEKADQLRERLVRFGSDEQPSP